MDYQPMTRKFLIATHGAFAQGVRSALDIIMGEGVPIHIIQAYLDGNSSIEPELISLFGNVPPNEQWIVFTDLLGGSVNNQLLRYGLQENIHIVSGFNLPLLLEAIMAPVETPAEEVIENAIRNAQDQMVYVNRLLTPNENKNDYDQTDQD
jgi:fructoselysine and glucoselysine-specific PTS system IIA component